MVWGGHIFNLIVCCVCNDNSSYENCCVFVYDMDERESKNWVLIV